MYFSFCIKSYTGDQGEVGWPYKCFNPPPVIYSIDRSKAVVPVLVLPFFTLWCILRGDLFDVLPCVIFSCGFQCACLIVSVSSSSWCLGWALFCDCGTSLTFLLPMIFSQRDALMNRPARGISLCFDS